jgi:signal transduction histidine kinase
VYIAELAFPPALGLPVAAVVVAAYVGAVPHPAGAPYLVIQAVVTAALMTLVRRGGRNADAVIGGQLRVAQETQAEAARRADQRQQYRRLHDTILSTLTMVAAGALDQPSPVLSAQASRDLRVLHALSSAPEADPPGTVSLGDRLRDVAAAAAPLRVALAVSAPDDQVPAAAADRLAACAAEALRNVSRHAGTGSAQIQLSSGPGGLVVQIIDQGRGFEAQSVARGRRGISESISGRMSEIGGSALVSGAPGQGTTVTLRWPG